jgi:phosphoglycerate dehydrogenase-like enzyme
LSALLDGAPLIQFMIDGVDFIPLGELPEGVPVATNGGGYAASMAEDALATALAAAKRLILEHENLKLGQFGSRGTACSRAGSAESSALAASERRDQPADAQHRPAGARHQPAWPDG